MTYKEIRAGEELIAEFMGLYRSDGEDFGGQTKEMWFSKKTRQRMIDGSPKYRTDWNSLMPVVEKIESFHLYFYIDTHGAYIEHMGCEDSALPWLNNFWNQDINYEVDNEITKLDCVWLTCVQFIKWYNEQKK